METMRAIPAPLSILAVASCLCTGAQAQQAPSADPAGKDQIPPPPPMIRFEGAEKKNCPTGAVMFVLLGSRATFTVPSIPRTAKDAPVPSDFDAYLFGNTLMRSSRLPDHSGSSFEFIKPTCTIEITVRYR
jgi:hypothetical protein